MTQVAQTLAAHGGGAVSVDLAFELVLNHLVEQAKEGTGANGAAIALIRDGSLVCRATTGDNAPDLGVRVETASSLAGSCLASGSIEQCRDTDADARVNAEACRRLGVRSMLIAPLIDAGHAFGILQVFSAWPNAFGERETSTLQSLAQKIAESKREAEASTVLATGLDNPADVSPESIGENRGYENSPVFDEHNQKFAPEAVSLPVAETPSGSELWTSFLIVLVIGTAVLLGVAIGWHGAAKGPNSATPAPKPSTLSANSTPSLVPESQTAAAVSASAQPAEMGETSGLPNSGLLNSGSLKPGAKTINGGSSSLSSSSLPLPSPAGGGLVVTENGKVIYRSIPQGMPSDSATTGAANSGTRLIHRVEPEYPLAAREQNVQGTVVLVIEIHGDGSIGEIGVASGDPILVNAATKAVRQWRYQPYAVNGQPVERQTRISIKFTLPPS